MLTAPFCSKFKIAESAHSRQDVTLKYTVHTVKKSRYLRPQSSEIAGVEASGGLQAPHLKAKTEGHLKPDSCQFYSWLWSVQMSLAGK